MRREYKSPKTSKEQRDRVNERNDKLRAKGVCISCAKAPARGEGATGGRCPACSETHREAARLRYRRLNNLPEDMEKYGNRKRSE